MSLITLEDIYQERMDGIKALDILQKCMGILLTNLAENNVKLIPHPDAIITSHNLSGSEEVFKGLSNTHIITLKVQIDITSMSNEQFDANVIKG